MLVSSSSVSSQICREKLFHSEIKLNHYDQYYRGEHFEGKGESNYYPQSERNLLSSLGSRMIERERKYYFHTQEKKRKNRLDFNYDLDNTTIAPTTARIIERIIQ